jgi:hypothetical protein
MDASETVGRASGRIPAGPTRPADLRLARPESVQGRQPGTSTSIPPSAPRCSGASPDHGAPHGERWRPWTARRRRSTCDPCMRASCPGPSGLFKAIVARLRVVVNRLKPDRAAREGRFLPLAAKPRSAWASTRTGAQP